MTTEEYPKWIYLGNIQHEWFEIMHCRWPRFIMRITDADELNGRKCTRYEIVNWLDKVGFQILSKDGLRDEMREFILNKKKTGLEG